MDTNSCIFSNEYLRTDVKIIYSNLRRMISCCWDGGWVKSCVHVVTDTSSSSSSELVVCVLMFPSCSARWLRGGVVVGVLVGVVVVVEVRVLTSMTRDSLVQEPYCVSRTLHGYRVLFPGVHGSVVENKITLLRESSLLNKNFLSPI